jgi:rod shape-determining protein MreB
VSADLALDLGTSITRVADRSGTIVLEEPTLAAVDTDTGKLVAFGREAVGLGARSAGRVALVRPVRNGKLVDVDLAQATVAEILRRSGASFFDHPRVVVCSHVDSTPVQQRAVERALRRAGARSVRFVEQPLACALGARLPIAEAVGRMVVDVGGGTTDVGVLALGGLVTSAAVPVGGNVFDEVVRDYLARVHRLVVERRVVEVLRREVGSVGPVGADVEVDVVGRDALTGLPGSRTVSRRELAAALEPVVEPVVAAAMRCMTSAPPDLANDLLGTGVLLAGGGSLLDGLARRLASAIGVPVHVPERLQLLGVLGAARSDPAPDRPPALAGLTP